MTDLRVNTNITEQQYIASLCVNSQLFHTRYLFKKNFGRKFVVGDHHKKICEVLDRVINGELTRVIINIFPRSSKTEIAVKHFISRGLAINPASKFIHISYSAELALDNSEEIKETVESDAYQELFPIRLKQNTRSKKKWYTEDGGGVYATSAAGQLTGFGAGAVDREEDDNPQISLSEKKQLLKEEQQDIEEFMPEPDPKSGFAGAIIIDDPIKPEDAFSDKIRNRINKRFETTIRNRVNSRKTPIIIIMQRLHEDDLCGYLMKAEPDEWYVLSLPALYEDEQGNLASIWDFKLTVEELLKIRKLDPYVFDTQYQQEPTPLEGLMYRPFKLYEIIPHTSYAKRKNYTDTADDGSDYLCSIDYVETEIGNFVTNVLYTDKNMEYTEPATAEMVTIDRTEEMVVESNNGGKGFARNVERQCRIMKNDQTAIEWFFQGANKNARIFTHSAAVNNLTYFPVGWDKMWPEFYDAITKYRKKGKNLHDDGPDALTGTVERRNVPAQTDKEVTKEYLGFQ